MRLSESGSRRLHRLARARCACARAAHAAGASERWHSLGAMPAQSRAAGVASLARSLARSLVSPFVAPSLSPSCSQSLSHSLSRSLARSPPPFPRSLARAQVPSLSLSLDLSRCRRKRKSALARRAAGALASCKGSRVRLAHGVLLSN